MKLACCKVNGLTLKEETFNMNKFKAIRIMKQLIGGMGLMFLGMSIPVIVFKACEESMKYVIDGKMYGFDGVIPEILNVSSLIMTQIAQVVIMFTLLLSVLKAIKSGDMKQFGKEVLYMVIAYLSITIFKFIPIAIPNTMKAMGYL